MEENIQIGRGSVIPTQTVQPTETTQKKYDFPTEVISLPSEGKAYPEGHPLSNGTVEIKLMTAREEDILSSQNLIKKGIVLEKLFESVMIDPKLADEMLVGDKNAVLIVSRMLAYGPEYVVEMTDPYSGLKQKQSIDLSELKPKEIDYSQLNPQNRYTFTTPSGRVIEFKLLTHKDEKDITAEIQAMQRLTKSETSLDLTTRLKKMITGIDGNTDRGTINRYVDTQMLARDTKAFRDNLRKISPDLDLKFNFVSESTGEVEALDIPFGVDFFYPTE
jgi:hypothetical protein